MYTWILVSVPGVKQDELYMEQWETGISTVCQAASSLDIKTTSADVQYTSWEISLIIPEGIKSLQNI